VHQVSVELCDRAVHLIEDAGAATDDTARRRLVAGARQTRTLLAFGGIEGMAREANEIFLRETGPLDGTEE
jgi:hypothetical protein